MVEEKVKLERERIEEQWKLRDTRMQEILRFEKDASGSEFGPGTEKHGAPVLEQDFSADRHR